MRIAVTGANGYLGQGIVKSILDNGHDVIAVDFETNHIDERAKRISCNIFEIKEPFEFLEQPDALLHLAWRDGFIHNSEAHILDLPKHYKFIKNMLNGGIKKIAVMGSMHEIGFFEGSIKEDTPCNPMNLYGIGKNALRNAIEVEAKGRGVIFQWLRGYYIIGNSEFGSSVFSKITAAEKRGQLEFPFTMGQNQYDFIDYEVFCKQVAATVGQNEIIGIINICSGKPEKLSDKVEEFIKKNEYNIRLKYGVFPERPYDSKAVWGDDQKINIILKDEKYYVNKK
ncbi:NAD(P)-dependent oxidoreductase [Clostridium perfringens]|nr:NAD(P)-dependent oxidoreductase [Clostridium perfringens]